VFLEDYLKKRFDASAVFVSPDAGGVERTRAYSKRLNASLAIIDKRRERANVSEVMNLIGEVKGKDCIIIDDLIDTAGTLSGAARVLADKGARRVVACATHGVLSGPAVERIQDSPLAEVVVSDSIALSPEAKGCSKIQQLSLSRLLGEAIKRIHSSDSVSSLFA
jgi:ribose-phosphate pyrophosphokinase